MESTDANKITTKRLEWNPEHKSSDEQEMEWIKEYLSLPFEKKWYYLMSLSGDVKSDNIKGKRLEWI